MKICSKCGNEKPLSEYYKKYDTKDGLKNHCKTCSKIQNKQQYLKNRENRLEKQCQYYLKNSEHVKEYGKNWRKRNREYCKEYDLHRHYNLTKIEFEKILIDQNFKCAICNEILVPGKQTHIDHCHNSMKVRGILCHRCNTGIGLFKESIYNLKEAIKYIEKHEKN